jgi:hypothetical protein
VGHKDPESEGDNKERLEAAKQALIEAKALKAGADIVVLPAGFFTTRDSKSRQHLADSLISKAKELGIAIAFGVDEEVKASSKSWKLGKRRGKKNGWSPLPLYGYAWSPTDPEKHCWYQRSTNSADQWLVPDEKCKEVRLLNIGGETLAVLMCGELFNQRIRKALRDHSPPPKVTADLVHIGAGFRASQGMKKLGLASVCSLHVQRKNAAKPVYFPGKGYVSSRDSDRVIEGPPRIELKLWIF